MERQDFCIYADYLWDGYSNEPIYDGILVIKNGKIEAVGKRSDFALLDNMPSVRYKNSTVLPGFIDGHTHTTFLAMGPDSDIFLQNYDDMMLFDIGKYNVRRALHNGVTTLFDDGGYRNVSLWVRDAVRSGFIEGADVWASKTIIRRRSELAIDNGGDVDADNAEACQEFIEALVEKDRVDFVKIYLTRGGYTAHLADRYGSEPLFNHQVLASMVNKTHQLGRKLVAHCTTQKGIRAMIAAGGDLIAHCEFKDDNYRFVPNKDLVNYIGDSGIWINPTLYTSKSNHLGILYVSKRKPLSLEQQEKVRESEEHCDLLYATIYEIWKKGNPMIAGSDSGYAYYDFGGFEHELQTLCEIGIPIVDVLKMATSNPAEFMGKKGQIGCFTPGADADILVLNGNVFTDYKATERIEAIYKKGKKIAK